MPNDNTSPTQSDDSPSQAQLEELQKGLKTREAELEQLKTSHQEAIRAMNEAQRERAELSKRLETKPEPPKITDEMLEKFRDDPGELAKWNAEQAERLREETVAAIENATKGLTSELAEYLAESKKDTEERFKSLDPRYTSPEYQEAKKRWGDMADDETIFKLIEAGAINVSSPPGAPAGTGAVPPKTPSKTPDENPMFKQAFAGALNRLPSKENK